MSLGDHLGVAGLILALLGIAVAILWAEKKAIGWVAFVLAVTGGVWWIVHGIKGQLGPTNISLASALVVGGLLGLAAAWVFWRFSEPKRLETAAASSAPESLPPLASSPGSLPPEKQGLIRLGMRVIVKNDPLTLASEPYPETAVPPKPLEPIPTGRPQPSPGSGPSREPTPEVARAQVEELRQLSGFVARDEEQLRALFDFGNILQKNIEVQKIRIGLRLKGRYAEFKYQNFLEPGGLIIVLVRDGKYHVSRNGVEVHETPHDVLFMVITPAHQQTQQVLDRFIGSPLIPESVKVRLEAFKKVAADDIWALNLLLDNSMNAGDDNFLNSDEQGSPYFGLINNTFFGSFKPLKPSADQVLVEISKYLGTG